MLGYTTFSEWCILWIYYLYIPQVNKESVYMLVPVHEVVRVRYEEEPNSISRSLGYYDHVGICKCDECGTEFIDVFNMDPGSVEQAIGVRDMCRECWDKPDVDIFY